MKKRVISLLVCFAIVIALVPSFIYAKQMPSDISGHWAESVIADLIEKGRISGYEDGTFKPDNTITRAEFVTMINNIFIYTALTTEKFNDVNENDWFYINVSRAKASGYTSGYEDGTFRPNDNISRQEAATMLNNILRLRTFSVSQVFKDHNQIETWAQNAVYSMKLKNIISGYSDNTFRPTENLSRAEACSMICKSYNYLIDDIDKKFVDYQNQYYTISYVDGTKVSELGNGVTYFENNDIQYYIKVTPHVDEGYTLETAKEEAYNNIISNPNFENVEIEKIAVNNENAYKIDYVQHDSNGLYVNTSYVVLEANGNIYTFHFITNNEITEAIYFTMVHSFIAK